MGFRRSLVRIQSPRHEPEGVATSSCDHPSGSFFRLIRRLSSRRSQPLVREDRFECGTDRRGCVLPTSRPVLQATCLFRPRRRWYTSKVMSEKCKTNARETSWLGMATRKTRWKPASPSGPGVDRHNRRICRVRARSMITCDRTGRATEKIFTFHSDNP